MINDIALIYYAVLRDNKRFNPSIEIKNIFDLCKTSDECNFYSILEELKARYKAYRNE